ncbi:MAG: 16S rRNA (guanine(966)-N(2))-methyltransferase RsmD [Clostridia bacterium]|nr:16S rRNA (guanine(966)-N(2))-methyltransferase RsmD [Clostridia bacterium]
MRIVSGKYRGKMLKEFNLESTRPTTDRVKESIFNLIQFDVVDAVVLDLFSGTGALGVEAISRGAKKTYLVDKNIKAISIIKENLKGIDGDYVVKNKDYIDFLNSATEKFDIVFLDTPYATDFGLKAIDMLVKKNLLNENAIIIFETSEDKDVELNLNNFEIKKKKYGTVAVYKLEKLN